MSAIRLLIRLLIISVSFTLLLPSAYGQTVKKKTVQKVVSLPKPPAESLAAIEKPGQKPANTLTTTSPQPEVPARILNLKVSPLTLAQMIYDKNTLAAFRADVDFLVSSKVALGPSVVYHHMNYWDDNSIASGNAVSLDESLLDVGWLTSFYLQGDTANGGLILRHHAYYTAVTGNYSDPNNSAAGPAHLKDGIRSGAELLYQMVMRNGLNLEVGGGFTYYLIPYEIDYPNAVQTTLDNRFLPTVSVSIGWAF